MGGLARMLGKHAAMLCCPKKLLELSSYFLEGSLSYGAQPMPRSWRPLAQQSIGLVVAVLRREGYAQ